MGSVPNTNTFSLQDVVDAVQPSENTLQKCFDESVDEYFNSTYKGDKNSLYNFRDYKFTAVACSVETEYIGEVSYPTTKIITLGTDTGDVDFEFLPYGIPDLALIKYNGVVVVNTGYHGDNDYMYGGIYRDDFNDSLNGKIDPVTGETFPYTEIPFPSHIDVDGYPVVTEIAGNEWYYDSFVKSTQYPTQATVEIYAPMISTGWKFKLKCPI